MPVIALPNARANRKLQSWIAGFLEYTDDIWSTARFRKWGAIATVAGALERKVWVRSQGRNIYPNLFTFLVGPPSVGKTAVVEICEILWRELKEHKLAPVSITKASLVDELKLAERVCQALTPSTFNSLLICAKELGALLPGYDSDFLNVLTYLYDNLKYDEKRRGNPQPVIIERPQINLIGCTTPSYLLETMPIGAWDQGFLSRVIIIFDDFIGERKLNLMAEDKPENTPLKSALAADLRSIGNLTGQMKFSQAGNNILEAWFANKGLKPNHPRLQHYNGRRAIHCIKLSIIAAADRGSDLIDEEDAASAVDWLTEAEAAMPNLFAAMGSGGDAAIINEAHHYLITAQARSQSAVPIHRLYAFLQTKTHANRIAPIVETMIKSRFIVATTEGGVTLVTARPSL